MIIFISSNKQDYPQLLNFDNIEHIYSCHIDGCFRMTFLGDTGNGYQLIFNKESKLLSALNEIVVGYRGDRKIISIDGDDANFLNP